MMKIVSQIEKYIVMIILLRDIDLNDNLGYQTICVLHFLLF